MLYANLSRKHLEPAPFGGIRLDLLKPTNIDALVLAMKPRPRLMARGRCRIRPSGRPTRYCVPGWTARCAMG